MSRWVHFFSRRECMMEDLDQETNPRRVFDERKLRELAANVKDHGVLQRVLVRPHPGGDDGLFELVVGALRYRASKLAEKPSIPARIVNLTDSAALEVQIIENLHRADVHELGEAFGNNALMEQNPDLYTVEVIGTKVGKPPCRRTESSAALQAGAAVRHTAYSRESTYRRARSSPSASLG